MNITLLDLIILIVVYFAAGIIASTIGLYVNYFTQLNIKKLQLAYINKTAPEIKKEDLK